MNTTPSGVYFLNHMSKFARSADLEGLDNANNITVFAVRSDNDSLSILP